MASQRQPEDKWVFINNLNIHYLDWGGKSSRLLLLLPGLGGSAHTWDYFAESNCDEFHIIALDQRGHGDSDHAKDGYALVKLVDDIAKFSKATGLAKFDLCGVSLGGRTTIAYAGAYPETVKHAIIVDIAPEMALDGARRVNTRLLAPPPGFRSEEDAIEYYKQQSPNLDMDRIKHSVKYELRLNWAGKLVFKRDIEVAWATGSIGKKEAPMVWEAMTKITCPTLIMRGASSDVLSPELAKRMLSLLPKGYLVEIPDAGHAITNDNPTAFEAEVRRFLLS